MFCSWNDLSLLQYSMKLRSLAALLVLVLFTNPIAQATPIIQSDAKAGFTIKAESYEATVGTDGYLNHLRIGEQEFLLPDIDISRGTYFHQGGVVKMSKTTRTNAGTIDSEGPLASVRYAFTDNGMTWTVSNNSKAPMFFFAILPSSVSLGADAKGRFVTMPSAQNWNESSWFSESSKLTFLTKGSARQWAWLQGSTVMEINLAPGEKRVLELTAGKVTDADRAGMKAAGVDLGDLRISSPGELQVFQRTKRTEGPVKVAGKLFVNCDSVEVRFSGKDLNGKALKSEWQTVAYNSANSTFGSLYTLTAGGWYTAELRALKSGKEVATAKVAQFGVGEVFIGAGQSNSTNSGGGGSNLPTDGRIETKSGLVSSFDGKTWRIANDPQLGTHDKSQGGSFWPAFGDAMTARYHVPIGVVVTGHGGTSINQWKSGSELFNWTLGRIKELEASAVPGYPSFRALLWHQGESDADMKGVAYANGLGTIIREMRQQSGRNFTWFVAKASYRPGKPLEAPVTQGQKELWDKRVALVGPDTDAMLGELRDHGGKGIHFSKVGLKVHGEAWAEKVAPWLDQQIK